MNSLDCKEVFTDIYARNVWGDGSGGGSGEQALPYCAFISIMLQAERLYGGGRRRTVLDIGCGDGSVRRRLDLAGWDYVGIDANGTGSYSTDEMTEHWGFDALIDELPPADLILCKEVLQHLSNEQVQTLLDRTAHYPRRLFTNSTFLNGKEVNEDIHTGDFRAVDLALPPFNQPAKTVFTYGNWIVQELTKP